MEEKEKKEKSRKNKVLELEEKNKALEEEVLRAKADLINYRKRKDEETSNLVKYASSDLILSILSILDNFERAMPKDDSNISLETKNYLDGISMIYKSLKEVLESNGVKEIEVLNKPFDPKVANCVFTESNNDMDDDIVLEVFAKGYTYYDKILRCASVKVNKKSEN